MTIDKVNAEIILLEEEIKETEDRINEQCVSLIDVAKYIKTFGIDDYGIEKISHYVDEMQKTFNELRRIKSMMFVWDEVYTDIVAEGAKGDKECESILKTCENRQG